VKVARSRTIAALAATVVLLTGIISAALPAPGSITRTFSIDGERYSLAHSFLDDFSLIRRELGKHAIDLPPDPDVDPPPPPALSFTLASLGTEDDAHPLPLPPSFSIAHTLRLTGREDEVEIAFGTAGPSVRRSLLLLEARGWSCPGSSDRMHGGAVAAHSHGKERILAFLEAEGGRFLLVRRLVR